LKLLKEEYLERRKKVWGKYLISDKEFPEEIIITELGSFLKSSVVEEELRKYYKNG
jgi:hypothetical protein